MEKKYPFQIKSSLVFLQATIRNVNAMMFSTYVLNKRIIEKKFDTHFLRNKQEVIHFCHNKFYLMVRAL